MWLGGQGARLLSYSKAQRWPASVASVCHQARAAYVPDQVVGDQLERVVSGGSEGSGGQLARTSCAHYIGPVASDSLAHSWMHWGETTSHVLARCATACTRLPASCLAPASNCMMRTLVSLPLTAPEGPSLLALGTTP